MPTTLLATALPHSLADDAPFQLTVFMTHKLVGGASLSDFPAAADWVDTLAGCTLTLTTSLDPAAALPLRVVSTADAASWAAVLPPGTPVDGFPTPALSDETWRTNPASRMSDHAVDLHLAAITAAPAHRPGLAADPVASGLLETLANLDQGGPLRRLIEDAPGRARRALQVPAQRLRDALTTIGPLTQLDETDPERGHGREVPPLPAYQSDIVDRPSPVQVLLDDPEADLRVTRQLDGLVGQDLSANPPLQLVVDAHAMRRYYERPEQPQQEPRTEPDPDAPPTPRLDRPEHDFHAKVASFGSTPALLRRLGLAVDVVLDGLDAAGARAALTGATWVSVTVTSPDADLEVLRSAADGRRGGRAGVRGQVDQRLGGRCPAARRGRVGGAGRRPGRLRPQARPARSQPGAAVRQRGQRRPGHVGARHATRDRLRAGPPGPGRPAARTGAGGRGAGGRRRHPRAAARRPGARHPGRGLGRRHQGLAQPAPAPGDGDRGARRRADPRRRP